jgi:signal transduction histidine kinase/putative methionine-R-sulfoxide reductase with GAF domain
LTRPSARDARDADVAAALMSAREQQAAISEVLRVMSRSGFDLQAVFDVVVENATKLCRGDWGYLFRKEGDVFQLIASHGGTPALLEYERSHPTAITDRTLIGRVALRRRVVHIPDLFEDPDYDWPTNRQHGVHTVLGVPIFRDDAVVGAIGVARNERRPFSDTDIQLVQTFADQATIAMENVRLFNETKAALERQTAISEILRAIAKSPGDEKPVLQTIAQSAARFCGADDAVVFLINGDHFDLAAHHGSVPLWRDRVAPGTDPPRHAFTRETMAGLAVLDKRTIHIADALGPEGEPYPSAKRAARELGQRAILATPLIREDTPIGAIVLRKTEPIGFTTDQIGLVAAFADQAVIAIENVRLFNETKEALERQTATSSILNVISRSPADQQPTLDVIVESGARLCDAEMSFIYVIEQGLFKIRAGYKVPPAFVDFTNANPVPVTPHRGSLSGRVVAERRAVQIPDVLLDTEYAYLEGQRLVGYRAMLNVPMFSKGELIGLIGLWRTAPDPFTTKQIDLMSTFADQAVIAIENTRLFDETKEALENQTAVSEVLETINSSAFDLQPIFDRVLERAAGLCDADFAWMNLWEPDGKHVRIAAVTTRIADLADFASSRPVGQVFAAELFPSQEITRQALRGEVIHRADITADLELFEASASVRRVGGRGVLATPMTREQQTVGALVLVRRRVGAFREREVQLVRTFAGQAVIALENVRLFNEIRNKSRELEVASRHKSEFLANMSHELRTPLNAIIGFSEVLLQGIFGGVNEKQREYLTDVLGSGQHLLSLINDILDLSKIEAGRMDLELSTFALRDALESGLTIVRERAARHGIQLSTVVASDVSTIEADERKVKQILYNLLSNAVKFTPDGGRVDVSVRVENGDVRVEVRDTGIGVAAGDQERIFEEFRQAGRERSREGTGLGLTLTKRFVELHGGRIWLESSPGKGSTFAFTLPVLRAAAVSA